MAEEPVKHFKIFHSAPDVFLLWNLQDAHFLYETYRFNLISCNNNISPQFLKQYDAADNDDISFNSQITLPPFLIQPFDVEYLRFLCIYDLTVYNSSDCSIRSQYRCNDTDHIMTNNSDNSYDKSPGWLVCADLREKGLVPWSLPSYAHDLTVYLNSTTHTHAPWLVNHVNWGSHTHAHTHTHTCTHEDCLGTQLSSQNVSSQNVVAMRLARRVEKEVQRMPKDKTLSSTEMVAMIRLATNVHKMCVLASVTPPSLIQAHIQAQTEACEPKVVKSHVSYFTFEFDHAMTLVDHDTNIPTQINGPNV